jgi:nicotinamide phosphoribosyltransferase
MADSYKYSHGPLYTAGMTGMFAYGEARIKGEIIVPVGMQMLLEEYFTTPITLDNIMEAERFLTAHGEPFDKAGWLRVLDTHKGLLPLKIKVVPEGTPVPSGNILYSVESTDPELAWLVSWIETVIQRGIWYPTTIASNDHKAWRAIRRFARESSDDESLVPFTLHDFGGRGVSSHESAQIGGFAHLVHFMGSDTVEGIRAANHYYDEDMAAFSVIATEHSIQCSYGPTRQREYLETVIEKAAKPGAIVSIVIDGYDVYREAQTLCELKDKIIASGARIVFRPDSGDPLEVIPRLLKMQDMAFGHKVNTKGYKVINNVGIIQGDGVDLEAMVKILEKVTEMGYSASNIVFGSGGALLQKVNRDTYKFAQKTTAIRIGSKWVSVFKDPITDPGKKSKAGRLHLVRSKMTGEYMTFEETGAPLDSEWEEVMVTVYENGKLFNRTTLAEIRARAMS